MFKDNSIYVKVGDRLFHKNDGNQGRKELHDFNLPLGWYGGRAEWFSKTKEGFYLVIEEDHAIATYIPTLEGVTEEGLKLLKDNGYLTDDAAIVADVPVEPQIVPKEDSDDSDEGAEDIESQIVDYEVRLAKLQEGRKDIPVEQMTRKELVDKAKSLGIEGKLATFKTTDLIAMIQEKVSGNG